MQTRQSRPARDPRPARGFARHAGLALTLILAGCAGSAELGRQGFVEGLLGGIVATEPRAAVVGRDVLGAGGTAADAVVAAYFSMAVAFPAGAGLGGGGACLIADFATGQIGRAHV